MRRSAYGTSHDCSTSTRSKHDAGSQLDIARTGALRRLQCCDHTEGARPVIDVQSGTS
jgi:hypothetical protein